MTASSSLFTSESGRELQRKSVIARKRNQLAAETPVKEDDITVAVKRQIAEVLADMEKTRSRKEKDRLSRMVERLWNLVYPRAGARRPSREDQRRRPLPQAQDAWQVATGVATEQNETHKPQ